MSKFEYKAIVAPRRGKAAKGVRGGPEKFANAVSLVMNEMSSAGWEYLRADTLPNEERQGLTGRVVKYQSLLVFRRAVEDIASIDTLLAEADAENGPLEETHDNLEADLEEELAKEDQADQVSADKELIADPSELENPETTR